MTMNEALENANGKNMLLNLEEARLIQRSFIVVARHAEEEAAKIQLDPNASEYLKTAATQQYQTEMEGYSKLHVRLTEEFPDLTQR